MNTKSVIIGSARIDENGKLAGGKAGDQTGKEVSMQNFYVHSKGWYILRPKSADVAKRIANAMRHACLNNNIGYDQGNRTDVLKYGTAAKTPTETDCSGLIRLCVKEATGKDPGNFNTANEADVLEKSGFFEKRISYTKDTILYEGDVLVTKTKGHTVAVTLGNARGSVVTYPVLRKGSKGNDVKTLQKELTRRGFKCAIDGIFGLITEQKVKEFQKVNKLEIDGIVGVQTWKALMR